MAHLHRYKGGEGPTNVLTFAYMTGADIAICLQVAERDASVRGWDFLSELSYLCIHGCLHALGFDHSDPARAIEMGRLERQVLAKLDRDTTVLDP
ncbi:MAG: rRNA maturation RNase YbeY [Chloroflexi bacterium]|nr:rRNA maturation RNase YbeY [Chloroflexota bacterium]